MKLKLLRVWSWVLNAWDWVDGNKTLIGLVLNLINTKFISPGTTLYDIIDILVYIFVGVGGVDKVIKIKKGYNYGQRSKEE